MLRGNVTIEDENGSSRVAFGKERDELIKKALNEGKENFFKRRYSTFSSGSFVVQSYLNDPTTNFPKIYQFGTNLVYFGNPRYIACTMLNAYLWVMEIVPGRRIRLNQLSELDFRSPYSRPGESELEKIIRRFDKRSQRMVFKQKKVGPHGYDVFWNHEMFYEVCKDAGNRYWRVIMRWKNFSNNKIPDSYEHMTQRPRDNGALVLETEELFLRSGNFDNDSDDDSDDDVDLNEENNDDDLY